MSVSPGSSRRTFLAALAAAACTPRQGAVGGPTTPTPAQPPIEPSTGRPGAIDAQTLAEAEKLLGVHYTHEERAQILDTLEDQLARTLALRKQPSPNDLAPATVFDPRLPGRTYGPAQSTPSGFRPADDPLPARDEDIVFAPVRALAGWIFHRRITSARLTELYLDRLRTHGDRLQCVVTLTADLAAQQAHDADRERARGKYRGPLHGIPWGAKDLLDTRAITTTWGAEPYRNRVPPDDAVVVRRLRDAGAVLVAKLSLGALAYGDIWHGGVTRNPWDLREGSSGSSAGSAAAVAAGLVGFAIGTETYGSIVSPSSRCGTTGLRPTFGRVPRTGAMALCWSLDKIGPIARTVQDCALVLAALCGPDPGDPSSIDIPLDLDLTRPVATPRIGYDPTWFDGKDATAIDRHALTTAREAGFELVPIEWVSLPSDSLLAILDVEAAAAFEALTLEDRDDELRWQEPDAWPNVFRSARFVSAIEYIQAQRFRRRVMEIMEEQLNDLDAIMGPSFAGDVQLVTNFTGHPCVTIRAGFERRNAKPLFDPAKPHAPKTPLSPQRELPRGLTLWGRLFDEGTLVRIAHALERALAVWDRRPPLLHAP